MKINFLIVCYLLPVYVKAQAIRFSKLEVKQGETIMMSTDTTFVDTLILNDQSELKFMFPDNVLVVKNAILGSGCILNASGQNGAAGDALHPGGYDGLPGKNLTVVLYISKLGDLTISTRGGDGGNGVATGITRGTGGNGGNGGAISFFYNTENILMRFNSTGQQVVNFDYTFGTGGKGAQPFGIGVPVDQKSSLPIAPPTPFNANSPVRAADVLRPGGNGAVGKLEFAKMELKF
jgi:hypothetical protein